MTRTCPEIELTNSNAEFEKLIREAEPAQCVSLDRTSPEPRTGPEHWTAEIAFSRTRSGRPYCRSCDVAVFEGWPEHPPQNRESENLWESPKIWPRESPGVASFGGAWGWDADPQIAPEAADPGT